MPNASPRIGCCNRKDVTATGCFPISGRDNDRSCNCSDNCCSGTVLLLSGARSLGWGNSCWNWNWNLVVGEGSGVGNDDWSAEMALRASAVVKPRLPILMFADPYLYIQPGPHPPSSHCSGKSCVRSCSSRRPTTEPASTRIASESASPEAPARSSMRVRKSGTSRAWSVVSELERSSFEAKKRKHSAVS